MSKIHSFDTYVPYLQIAERLGHTKITTTIDTYSHLLPNMQRDATDRLDETILGTTNNYGCQIDAEATQNLKQRKKPLPPAPQGIKTSV